MKIVKSDSPAGSKNRKKKHKLGSSVNNSGEVKCYTYSMGT